MGKEAETYSPSPPAAMSSKTIISQLKPFSARRFDACMNYLMHEYGASTLDQHDITKLHVMIDFFHVLETGKQVIGGELAPWKHGPVIKSGYNRIKSLGHRFDEDGQQRSQGSLRIIGKSKSYYQYSPYGKADRDTFSSSELNAMRRAWQLMMPMTFKQRESFFHSPTSYIGKVWASAYKDKREIDWADLIEAFDQQHDQDHTGSKLLVDMWRES